MWPSTPAERRHLAWRCRNCWLRRFRASRPPQNSSFRGSIPHPIRSLCTLRTRRRRRLRNTRFPAARYHLTGADLSPAETRQLRLTHRNSSLERLANIIAEWAESLPIERVYIFGSQVRGDNKPSSDLDVAIEFSPTPTNEEMGNPLLLLPNLV